ncbi:MAG: hypothetical protein Q9159_000868 [Coniocarpon cinnabarinum]
MAEEESHQIQVNVRLHKVETPLWVIRGYVDQYIDSSSGTAIRRRCDATPGLQDRILDAVEACAKGSFRVAELCIAEIKDQSDTLQGIEDALEDLSDSLDKAYAKSIARLPQRSASQRIISLKALTWVAVAKRALTSNELKQALALRFPDQVYDGERGKQTPLFKSSRAPDLNDIISNTRGLLATQTDPNSGESLFTMHLTLRQYIQDPQRRNDPQTVVNSEHVSAWFPDWQRALAIEITKLLTLQRPRDPDDEDTREYPDLLYRYVAMYWPEHVRPFQHIQEIRAELVQFLQDERAVLTWLRIASRMTTANHRDVPLREGAIALHICASYGLHEIIPALSIPAGYLDLRDPFFGRTPLVHACREGHGNTTIALIKRRARAELADNDGYTALIAACERSQEDIVRELLDCSAPNVHPDPNVNHSFPQKFDQTALMLAVARSGTTNERIVSLLLSDSRVHVNQTDRSSQTALMIAARCGGDRMLDLLLERRTSGAGIADLEVGDMSGRTALILAAEEGHLGCVEKLIDHGARPDAREAFGGGNFLQFACNTGHIALVKAVHGRVPASCWESRDKYGRTLLHSASVNGRLDVAQFLLEDVRLSLHAQGDKGETALHDACRQGYKALAQLLLGKADGVQIRDHAGRTPAEVAWQNGNAGLLDDDAEVDDEPSPTPADIADTAADLEELDLGAPPEDPQKYPDLHLLPTWSLALLNAKEEITLRASQDPNTLISTDPDTGNTPVHWAVITNSTSILCGLLTAGLDPNAKNDTKRTPLHLAALKGHATCADILLSSGADPRIPDPTTSTSDNCITVLDIALFPRPGDTTGHDDTALVLITQGPPRGLDISALTPWSKNDALMLAVGRSNVAAVQILCENGANPWAQDQGGISARMLARMNGDDAVFEVLDAFRDPALFKVGRREKEVSGFKKYLVWSMEALARQKGNLPV